MLGLAFLSFLIPRPLPRRSSLHQFSRRHLNRILFDWNEVRFQNDDENSSTKSQVGDFSTSLPPPTVTLDADDYRTIHAAKILGVCNNDTIRVGIISSHMNDGLLTDTATIEWIPQGKVKKAEPLARSGNPPGLLRIHLHNLKHAYAKSAGNGTKIGSEPISINVSLILALPRPLQLNRVLPMISQMGVDHLVLTGASKVPKDYFGSHLFRKPQLLRDRLIEGLCQSGDVRLPHMVILNQLWRLCPKDEVDETQNNNSNVLDQLFPVEEYARVVAHPLRHSENGEENNPHSHPIRMDQVQFPQQDIRKIVLAVGPEGGWLEPDELDWFVKHGFQHVTLGPRVLRSDCAVVSLLALAHLVVSCSREITNNESKQFQEIDQRNSAPARL
ncbi:hypothetical protein ACA910_001746 [Epithemia clementina (nom. ined.)]